MDYATIVFKNVEFSELRKIYLESLKGEKWEPDIFPCVITSKEAIRSHLERLPPEISVFKRLS